MHGSQSVLASGATASAENEGAARLAAERLASGEKGSVRGQIRRLSAGTKVSAITAARRMLTAMVSAISAGSMFRMVFMVVFLFMGSGPRWCWGLYVAGASVCKLSENA